MTCIFVLALFASAASERILVVTPQTHLSDSLVGTSTEDDSYVEAHREMHNAVVRDRRNPLGSYEENYNTLSHSSFVEDDVYPELNHETMQHHKPHRHHHHHRHPPHPPAVVYGPPTPVSYYHHHHHHRHQHPEHVSSHHTLIDIFPPYHFFAAFLHKLGIHKIVKIVAKIAILKVILKFITVIALFLVLPAFAPQDKEKEDSEDDGLLKSLGDVTDRVWNGIAAREKMEVLEHHGNNQTQHPTQQTHPEISQKPPQHVTDRPDKDKDKDKCKDKEKDKCKDKDKNTEKDKCKDKEKEKEKHKDEGELDDVEMKLLKKIIKQWKDENFGGPDKSSAISFLRNCVTTVNRILGILLGYLKMKHGNMDVLDTVMFNRFSVYMKNLVKMWPHLMPASKGSSSPFA